MTASRLIRSITGKNVVFITVKNKKYIRVSQIERLLHAHAKSFSVYASEKKNPATCLERCDEKARALSECIVRQLNN